MKTSRWGLLRYTFFRVVLFLIIWAIFQFLTPWKGLAAFVAAILISGAISFFLLDRLRDDASGTLFGFFGRINARIDASTRAEDVDDDVPPPSGQGQADTEK